MLNKSVVHTCLRQMVDWKAMCHIRAIIIKLTIIMQSEILPCSDKYRFWISASDYDDNNIFTNIDGSPLRYDNFPSKSSSTRGECATLDGGTAKLYWTTKKCTSLHRSLCSYHFSK